MELMTILADVAVLNSIDTSALEITDLYYDSRRVGAGGLFFALPGASTDGHHYIDAAIAGGAVAIVAERAVPVADGVRLIVVADARYSMALAAATFYGYPARDLLCVAVTGTNGKTTMTYLVESMLRQAGYTPAVVGTVSNRLGDLCYVAEHTTPESLDLQRLLHQFRQQGADALVIEVSSHALMQSRIAGLSVNVAVFTNLTPEHLDYHKTMENYFLAKSRLFTDYLARPGGWAVIHCSDPYGARLATQLDKVLCVGQAASDQIRVIAFEQSLDGITAQIKIPYGIVAVHSELIGHFNLENLSCAVGVGAALQLPIATIERGLAAAKAVPGRLERIENTLSALILVDYAHTGDALEKALQAVAALHPARIITLFGCGGDRDPGKRPVMGEIAARLSQLTVVTSDNPRRENPQSIIDQIVPGVIRGCDGTAGATTPRYVVLPERGAAIQWAVDQLQSGDVLLVAGKGHEDYQIIGNQRNHFDDREQVRAALQRRRQRENTLNRVAGNNADNH